MQTENHTIPSRKGSTVTETIDICENNYIKEEMIKVETIKNHQQVIRMVITLSLRNSGRCKGPPRNDVCREVKLRPLLCAGGVTF